MSELNDWKKESNLATGAVAGALAAVVFKLAKGAINESEKRSQRMVEYELAKNDYEKEKNRLLKNRKRLEEKKEKCDELAKQLKKR